MSRTAVVLGGSLAGLLAATALTPGYSDVVVVDRDALPDEVSAVPRRGVPHGRHVHGLLGGGLRAIEKLLPGVTRELVARGVPAGDTLRELRFCPNGFPSRQVAIGETGLSTSRPFLESYLRSRVLALPRVRVLDRTDIVGLVANADATRITGVRVHRAFAEHEEVLPADLVVDATGRGSRTPLWLTELGYEPPEEERLRVDLTYTTRHYALTREDLQGDLAVMVGPTVQRPRGGAMQVLEGDRGMITLFGIMGDSAPDDDAGFLEFARSLPLSDLYDAIRDARPLDDPVVFRFPASVRRRYERLKRFPAGLLVIGDAICSFNPLYGQGMSVAAMEAVQLRRALRDGLDARAYFRAIKPLIDTPWQIVVGGDLSFPQVEGERPAAAKFLNAYLFRLNYAAMRDGGLAKAFARVANLIAPPPSLLRPDRLLRVLIRGRGARSRPRPTVGKRASVASARAD